MMRSYKFRLYPDPAQKSAIDQHRLISKNIWNDLLASNKRFYSDFGYFHTKKTLREMAKKSGLHSQVAQELVDRQFEAIQSIFLLKAQGIRKGFPRFKSIDRMKSMVYPQSGFMVHKRSVEVTPFGFIPLVKHRKIRGRIKTLTIKKEADNEYYAIFSVEEDGPEQKINTGKKIGIDLGLIDIAVLSNGTEIKNPRHLKNHEKALIKAHQNLSKKKRGSKNRRKAKEKVAKKYSKVKKTRDDFLHKVSHDLVKDYSLIALENLDIKDMVEEGRYAKSIHDASWGTLTRMIRYKAASAGSNCILVDPKDTTKTCSNCGNIQKKHLYERQHCCAICGIVYTRDVNAAINILKRATNGMLGSNACGDVSIETSLKQEPHKMASIDDGDTIVSRGQKPLPEPEQERRLG